ncbi:hypothetical protein GCM10022415_27830 [Knoellia locipacati]|uniref:DUF4166 domain-containing protein n=1 Tax=Knoellia locipacati TaxID=882824 RepID=A0A512T4K2_9MICO|nr:hypothetical protein [Knoellia locipacati]GEQ15021.1 hypothetical protein KLO01_30680 [Knoellia locipacati]
MSADRAYRVLDAGTRAWWRTVGRRVDLDGEHAWLRAPAAEAGVIGPSWLDAAAAAVSGTVERGGERGLVPDLAALDGPGFSADDLAPDVRDFYERTGAWTMDAWSSWSPLFQPGGMLVEHLFGRRLQQLALPVQPLDVSHGIDSEIVGIVDGQGRQVSAAWLRRLRRTGQFLFSGAYAVRSLPGAARPSVHVTFPLEKGNVQVFLRPEVRADGALVLSSASRAFGRDGAYVVVHGSRGEAWAARVPIHEEFVVHVDDRGELRTDHELRVGRARALRLHYRMRRGKVGQQDSSTSILTSR